MKIFPKIAIFLIVFFVAVAASGALSVKMDDPDLTGTKAVIKLTMKNAFTNKVESARAVAFVMDSNGKVLGQAAQWVIGGTKDKPALAPNQSTPFYFVVPLDKAVSGGTNSIKAKVSFIRLVLEGGQQVDASKFVTVESTAAAKKEK